MPNPLTTPITKTISQYEVTAGNLDFVGEKVTLQLILYDASGVELDRKTFTKTFAEVGISAGQVTGIKTALVNRLKAEGIIN